MKITSGKINISISVVITFENQTSKTYICNPSDKIKDSLTKFADFLKIDFQKLFFLYAGNRLSNDDINKAIYDLMNSLDKRDNKMNILVYSLEVSTSHQNPDEINLIIIFESNETEIIKENRDKLMKDIFKSFAEKKKLDINKLIFKYGDKKIDLNKKFDDIANSLDKKCLGMTILVYHRTPLVVNFVLNNITKYSINCFLEDNIREIFNLYCFENKLNINNLIFTYQNNPVNLDNNFLDLNTNEPEKSENDILNVNSIETDKKTIEIKVLNKYNDNIKTPPTSKNNNKCLKIFLITLAIVLVVTIVIIVLVLVLRKKDDDKDEGKSTNKGEEEEEDETCLKYDSKNIECQECYMGYNLVDGKCYADFFIKAVYQTIADGDTINLIYSEFYLSRIIYMIIDGIKVDKPKERYYQFPKKGNHIVYIKIDQYMTSLLFSSLPNLISVSFTDFHEYFPNFETSFIYCTNLLSVDMSKIYYNYSYSFYRMFDGCSSLKKVKFKTKNFIVKNSMEKMFFDCKSLTSIDLSNLDVTGVTTFENMFSGCNSIQTINLKGFKLIKAKNINGMFYDCYSLKYIDLSSFQPVVLNGMKNVFYNCSSLTSINLNRFYTSLVTDMSFLFLNCSSLKILDLSSFNTQKVQYIYNMFQNCASLTSIIFSSSFVLDSAGNLDSFFSGCHSLEYIDFDITITTKIRTLTKVFSDCYSLKSITFSNFEVYYYSNLKEMFSGCYSLTSLDLSFEQSFRNLNTLQLEKIFYDCPNLSYIKFFKIDVSNDFKLFNKNISNTGTIILTENYKNSLEGKNNEDNPPSTWIKELY